MKKALYILGIALGLVFFYVSWGQAEKENGNLVIVQSTIGDISQKDIDRVRKEAEKALSNISPILGIKHTTPITIKIVEGGICNAYGGIISLPIRLVKQRKAAIVHEVTHIITRHGYNRFFSEGLAIYFQERFGEDHGFPNFSGVPLDKLVRQYRNNLHDIYELNSDGSIFTKVGTKKREIAYIQAGSFVNFLVETYGEKNLTELHNSISLNYKEIYGKDIKELGVDWYKFVLGD